MHALPLGELRSAIRRLRKDAGSTVAALAFAIGAAVATWSLLSAVLRKPLSVAEPERLFLVDNAAPPNVVAIMRRGLDRTGVRKHVLAYWSPVTIGGTL